MPCSAWITPAPSWSEVRTGQGPFNLGHLEEATEGLRRCEREDGTIWTYHPSDGSPWFAARIDAGHIVLSTSFANGRFFRNVADMLSRAATIAAFHQMNAFEDVTDARLDSTSLDSILAPSSAFTEAVKRRFEETRAKPARKLYAPLEFPVGGQDVTDDFLVLRITSSDALLNLASLLPKAPSGLSLKRHQDAALVTADEGICLARVVTVDARIALIRPSWTDVSFTRQAQAVIGAADALELGPGMSVDYNGSAFDDDVRAWILDHAIGLAVEYLDELARAARATGSDPLIRHEQLPRV